MVLQASIRSGRRCPPRPAARRPAWGRWLEPRSHRASVRILTRAVTAPAPAWGHPDGACDRQHPAAGVQQRRSGRLLAGRRSPAPGGQAVRRVGARAGPSGGHAAEHHHGVADAGREPAGAVQRRPDHRGHDQPSWSATEGRGPRRRPGRCRAAAREDPQPVAGAAVGSAGEAGREGMALEQRVASGRGPRLGEAVPGTASPTVAGRASAASSSPSWTTRRRHRPALVAAGRAAAGGAGSAHTAAE